MSNQTLVEELANSFDRDKLIKFLRKEKGSNFKPRDGEKLGVSNKERFSGPEKIGELRFDSVEKLAVIKINVNEELTERTSKQAQYKEAKKILKEDLRGEFDAGIFVFVGENGNYRLSLVYEIQHGSKRSFSNFRRYTFYISSDLPNKTFISQFSSGDFTSLDGVKEVFSISAVTDQFYKKFKPKFDKMAKSVEKQIEDSDKTDDEKEEIAEDFVLLFVIRTIFIGFVQKRKWINEDDDFLMTLWEEYDLTKSRHNRQVENEEEKIKDNFYKKWLQPLFLEALSKAPGAKVQYGENNYTEEIEQALQMAPYLNGGLFREKEEDKLNLYIPDEQIEDFFKFIFSYNFTIEENKLYDEDLELNPEFLGIIFERLVNKEDGAVYTPRTEVDFMCRMSLVKWLEKNTSENIETDDLYELIFPERGIDIDQKYGSFSVREMQEILDKLRNITICDPAVGSGAFPVGMIHVLEEIEEIVEGQIQLMGGEVEEKTNFERKKRIIQKSLYGVEVKHWAVWICQLRLWITLFIDAPEELKNSMEPILPSLDFKIRQGDSLVQRIGDKMFPVKKHARGLGGGIKRKITNLKKKKLEYFQNEGVGKEAIEKEEANLFRDILDNEIKKLQDAISGDYGKKQDSLLGEQQKELQLSEKKKLKEQLRELKEQRKALKKENLPFVWNIEFPEIFMKDEESGGFDVVIGNPPYVRQEDIEDSTGRVENKSDYKNLLQDMVRSDFPIYFENETIYKRSDLFTYFYIRGIKLLNDSGVKTYICSNSWLDVGYGKWLQEFLLEKAPLNFVFDNLIKRSFGGVDVNTIITNIEAPRDKVRNNHLVKFVAFKKPFESVIFSKNLIDIEKQEGIVKTKDCRNYSIKNKDLYQKGVKDNKYDGAKWGSKFLRAPDIYFDIIDRANSRLKEIQDIAKVKFGLKTGANQFFYLRKDDIEKHRIEDEFLQPILKSPTECKSVLIDKEKLRYHLFLCNKAKQELKNTNALSYIKEGESEGFNERPSVGGGKNWWHINVAKNSNIFWPMTIRKRLGVYYSQENIIADARLYEVSSNDMNSANLALLLNSTLTHLFIELNGRNYGGGGGPIDIKIYEIEKILIPEIEIKNNKDLLNKIGNRELKDVFDECGIDPQSDTPISEQEPDPMEDRKELDDIIFDELGLEEEERKEVYRAVCQLVWNRISKANS